MNIVIIDSILFILKILLLFSNIISVEIAKFKIIFLNKFSSLLS